MNLDDSASFRALDSQDMIGQINGLPDQLDQAYHLGLQLDLPKMEGIRTVLVTGMGGSAIGADLVAAYVADRCSVPVLVHRDYGLPAWAKGPETLVIPSSHSGNTEETLSSFQEAHARGCQILAVSTGGKLAEQARAKGYGTWVFPHSHAPRTAVGFSFGLIEALLFRLGLVPDPSDALIETIHAMRNLQTNLLMEVPVKHNPAKRMAGQLMGRWVSVFASDYMAPVARRWKGQISELAKAIAQFEALPEADHNTLAGLEYPQEVLSKTTALFLQAPGNHPRNLLRLNLTRQLFMQQGLATDVIEARGHNSLAHIWTTLLYGDYTAYYLAMSYGVDPTPIDILTGLKNEMAKNPAA